MFLVLSSTWDIWIFFYVLFFLAILLSVLKLCSPFYFFYFFTSPQFARLFIWQKPENTLIMLQLSPLPAWQTNTDHFSETSGRNSLLNQIKNDDPQPLPHLARGSEAPLVNRTQEIVDTLVFERRRVHLSRTVIMSRPCLCAAAVPSVPWFSGCIWD